MVSTTTINPESLNFGASQSTVNRQPRAVLKSKCQDGTEDPTAAQALKEVRENFEKEVPESWAQCSVDAETLSAHTDASSAANADALASLCLCGSKNGTVFSGLDNCGIPTLRLQALGRR